MFDNMKRTFRLQLINKQKPSVLRGRIRSVVFGTVKGGGRSRSGGVRWYVQTAE